MKKPPPDYFDDGLTDEEALAEAEADIAAGRLIPHEEVMRWIKSWGKPDELPPPKCK